MSKLRRYKRKRVFAMPFRDAAGKVGVVVPSNMTIEDAVRLGMDIKMVPQDAPLPPNTYRYDYERDMPKDNV
jgi:hypothetical protein